MDGLAVGPMDGPAVVPMDSPAVTPTDSPHGMRGMYGLRVTAPMWVYFRRG